MAHRDEKVHTEAKIEHRKISTVSHFNCNKLIENGQKSGRNLLILSARCSAIDSEGPMLIAATHRLWGEVHIRLRFSGEF